MSQPINISIARLDHGKGLALPEYQTPHAAGMDLLAALPETEPLVLAPMQRRRSLRFCHGAALGYEAQIRPRSGLALKFGLSMPNSPGTIDADYRGEIKVLLINLGPDPITLTRGMRIAQMVICPVVQSHWQPVDHVDDLPTSDRGTGGFGSTGT